MRPMLEKLEDRILLTAEPTVTIDGPSSVELGQQDVGYSVTFDNTSATDAGFAPFINVVLPTTGTDGDDGITFDSATFLGTNITPTQLVFDANGEAEHPVAVDANGDPLVIGGVPGDTLLVFELPYGSFTPNQAPVAIDLVLDFSPLADLDQALEIEAVGGFALGDDELDNPDADPSILGVATSATLDVEPTLITLTKENEGSEGETATGPNFPRTWTITLDVADGQTLTDVLIEDVLPNNVHYLGGLTISDGTAVVNNEPTLNQVVQPGDELLSISVPTVTGGTPITVSFDYFIPEFDAFGNPVIDPVTGVASIAQNDVRAEGDWTPLDPRDPPQRIVSDEVSVDDELILRSIAVQKSFVISDDQNVAGPTPEDTLTYTLEVQVSDFFTMGDIVLTDVLGDGLEFVGGSVEFSVNEEDGDTIATTAFDAGALTVNDDTPDTGQTELVFDLSAAILAEGAADGILIGDLIDSAQEGGTVATITYDARIKDQFEDPNDEAEVSQGDEISNDVTVTADVRDNADPNTPTGNSVDDTSSAGFEIPFGGIEEKQVVAINGVAPSPDLVIVPGDAVTFSVLYTAPLGSYEDLTLDDFLPLPVFDAAEVTIFNNIASATPPAAGESQFGAQTSAAYIAGAPPPPVPVVDTTSNSVSFDFGTFSIDPRQEIQIEILFTVSVEDAVFADGLLLTNQATTNEQNTGDEAVSTTAITQFVFAQPELNITKGVVAIDSTNPNGSIDGSIGPVGFGQPGDAGPRANGLINSTNLDSDPVDANLSDVDAGDLVTFAIVIENTGSAAGGAFDVQIQDTLPAGYDIPAGGLNLDVRDGTGAAVGFTDLGGGIFGSGIELDDDNANALGAIAAFDDTAGDNIIVVTYDLVVADDTGPQDLLENVASIENFTAFEDGVNRVIEPLEDNAITTTLDPSVDKQILTTNVGNDADDQVLIGEVVVFEIVIDLTEGTTEDVVFIDQTQLAGPVGDPGAPGTLEIVDAEITALGGNLTLLNAFNVGDGPSTPAFDSNGDGITDRLEFNFGDIINAPDNVANADDQIVIQVTSVVNSDASTVGGDFLINQGALQFEGEEVVDEESVRVRESNVDIEKTVDPGVVDAGDTVTFTVEITNEPLIVNGSDVSASAFDLILTDLISDPNLVFQAGTVVLSGSAAGDAVINTGNGGADTTIEVILDELETGETLIIEYQAVIPDGVPAGDTLVNTADLTYDSLPFDDDPNERDYNISDDAETLTRAPEFEKTVVATSFTETDGTDLGIGEFVTFNLTATIPEGEGPIIISDTLPTSPGVLTFISAEVIEIGDDLAASSALAVGATATPVAGTVTFDFGNIVNAPDADDLEEQIIVEVVARVDDLPDNASGDTLVNSATLTFGDDPDDTIDASASVDIVEPEISIDKIAPAGPFDAGDVVDYELQITNSGDGPAFDMAIADLLQDTGLALVSGSVTTSDATAAITEIGTGFRVEVDLLDTSTTLTINYQAVVQDAAPFNSTVPNTAVVEQFDSNPSDDPADESRDTVFDPDNPDEDLTDTEEVPTVGVELDKATTEGDSNQGETESDEFDPAIVDLSVGEEVTYTLTISVPEGSGVLVLTDALPPGLEAVSAAVTAFGTDISSANLNIGDTDSSSGFITISGAADEVEFDFGLVESLGVAAGLNDPAGAGDLREIEVTVTSIVADVAAATEGAQLTNTATLQVFDPDDPDTELTDPDNPVTATETVEVVEPTLLIEKSAPVAIGQGDEVEYQVIIQHDPDSTGPAFDLLVEDALSDPFLTLVSGSVSVAGATADPVSEIGDGFEVTIPLLEQGDVATITYRALLEPGAPEAESFFNTAELTFDSAPGDGGREQTIEDDARVATVPAIEKTLDRSSYPETDDPALGLGEVATYRIEIFLPEILNEDVTITDTLPAGLSPVVGGVRVIDVGANLTENGGGAVTDLTVPQVTIAGQTVTIAFEDIDNAFDGVVDDDDRIVVEFDAVVDADPAQNPDGTTLLNAAALNLTAGGDDFEVSDTDEISVVIPELALTKSADPTGDVDAGDEIEFTIEIENSGTGPAYDLAIEDLLADSGLSLVSGSVVSSDGSTANEVNNADGTVGFTLDVPLLDADETLTITYRAIVQDAAEFNGQVENQARVASFDTNPGEPGDAGFVEEFTFVSDPDDPDDPLVDDVEITTVGVALEKETDDTATSQGETTSDAFDPAIPDLSVGEEVTYTLTVSVPEGSGVLILTDSVPPGLQAVSAEVVAFGTDISSANLAVGDTDATSGSITISGTGDEVEFDFGLVVSAGAAAGLDDAPGAGDLREIEVTVTTIVADVAEATAGAQLTNTATLQVFDPDDPDTELTDPDNPVTATETVEVVEPALSLDKSTPETGPVDAGDIVTFTLTIPNTGTGPAFDIAIVDALLDTGFTLVSGTVVSSDGTTAVEVPNGDGTTGFTLDVPVLDAGDTLTVTYDVEVTTDFDFDSEITNTALIEQFDTSPLDPGDPGFEDQRVFTSDPDDPDDPLIDSVDLPTPPPNFAKDVFTTSVQGTGDAAFDPNAPDLAIGEIVVYRFTAVLPEGISDLVITDQFPLDGAFDVLDVIVNPTANISGPDLITPTTSFDDSNFDGFDDLLTIDLGTVTNLADNIDDANDILTIDVLVRIEDDPRNNEGDNFTNVATFDFGSGTVTDDAVIDVVEPELVITKDVSDEKPFLGDAITYTIVVENAASATGPIFDVLVEDVIQTGLTLQGGAQLSDPSLGTVNDGTSTGDDRVEVIIPVLQPGESVEITYDVLVEFTAPVLTGIQNTANVSGGTVPTIGDPPPEFPGDPSLANGPGRQSFTLDTAEIEASPVPSNRSLPTPNFSQIDDEQFLPIIRIDPIYSGSAEYGSNLTLTLTDQLGGFISTRNVLAGAAGQWIAVFPLLEIADDGNEFDAFFAETNVFEDQTGLLPEIGESSLFSLSSDNRPIRIGAFLEDDFYRLEIEEDAATSGSRSGAAFNTRLYYAPSTNHEIFVTNDTLDVSEIFEDIADLSVERLFNASTNPLAFGLNRFNAEILAASGTPNGL